MSPRPRAVSDDEVLAATARVIARDGPAQLTVAAVAAEAGFAASSLVQRFGSKRALLLAFAEQAPRGVAVLFETARARHADALDALEAALRAMVAPLRTPAEMANHLAFLQMDLADPEFRRHAAAHGRAFRREAERLLSAALADGRLATGDPVELASTLQIVFNGALVTWAIHGEGSLDRLVREVVPTVLRLQARSPAPRPPQRRSKSNRT